MRDLHSSAGDFYFVTVKDRPDLIDPIIEASDAVWPEFLGHDPIGNRYWRQLYVVFPEYQFALLDPRGEQVIAAGNSLPLAWEGPLDQLPERGWDWALSQGFEDHAAGRSPRIQCALSIPVVPAYQGRGISPHLVQKLKAIGRERGLNLLAAPVRPTLKSRYPLTAMEEYIQWRDVNGLPFDPWIRVHVRLGATFVKVCSCSMIITGTVQEWERWTQMRFPETGQYIVPEALLPVTIDRAIDRGIYVEPNVWMVHSLEPETTC